MAGGFADHGRAIVGNEESVLALVKVARGLQHTVASTAVPAVGAYESSEILHQRGE